MHANRLNDSSQRHAAMYRLTTKAKKRDLQNKNASKDAGATRNRNIPKKNLAPRGWNGKEIR